MDEQISKEQLDEMKKMMAQFMSAQNISTTEKESEKVTEEVTKKKAGRPPKKSS